MKLEPRPLAEQFERYRISRNCFKIPLLCYSQREIESEGVQVLFFKKQGRFAIVQFSHLPTTLPE